MRRKTGFTLIEVLVVVAIIALLVSILLPSLSAARRSAKNTKCKHNLHQIGVAMEAYLVEYKDYFPIACRMLSKEMMRHGLYGQNYDDLKAINFPYDFYHPLSKVLNRQISKQTELLECPEDFVSSADSESYLLHDGINVRDRYYDTEKTSYEWNDFLSDPDFPRRRKQTWIQLYTEDATTGNIITYFKARLCDMMVVNDFGYYHSNGMRAHNIQNMLFADMSIRGMLAGEGIVITGP